jgi:hypothetical protein
MLRFFAGLSVFQRQALGSGKSIALSALGFEQRDMLADMVYNSTDGPTAGGAAAGPGGGARPPQRMSMLTGDLASERTEMLPDGIVGGGILTVRTAERPALFGISPSGEKVAMGGPTVVIATDAGQTSSTPQRYDLYVPGLRSSYTFVFQLLQNVAFRRTLSDLRFDTSVKPVPYDQLPDDVRKRAEQTQNATIRVNLATGQNDGPIRP